MKAIKELGQNFLTDTGIASEIADLGRLEPGQQVWEIGPGKGILTSELVSRQADLTAFELDRRFEEPLKAKFGDNLQLVRADILRVNWQDYLPPFPQTIKLLANIPYGITSPLLSLLEEYRSHFELVVLMVQKEVAQRLTAAPKRKAYGLMTLRMKLFFDIELAFHVPRVLFDPIPNVDSAVIVMSPRQEQPHIRDLALYYRLIHHAFLHRRKTLLNNLLNILSKTELQSLERQISIYLSRRGETFSEAEFIDLCDRISSICYRP